ncbi:hypothetical protein ANAEL_00135 [Anaerolineales bacterium]|nr:hypothetical protein ANAEL_00135 [Anaerolineales bacterium]
MKVNVGDVLGNAFKIGWRHKILWLWQAIPGMAVIFVLPIAFIYYPIFTRLVQDPELQISIEPWMSISLNSIGILFVLSYVLMWIFAQLTTICGVMEIENGAAKLSFRELFRKSLSYVWRVSGLYFLFGGMWALISASSAPILGPVARNSLSTLELLSTLLALPLLIVWLTSVIVLELAQVAIVADNMRVIAAVLHAWKIFKSNLLNVVVIVIVLYYATAIPFGLLLMPFPFLVGISLMSLTRAPDPNIIFFTVLFVIIPLVVILPTSIAGVCMTFFQSGWAVMYLRLSGPIETLVVAESNP